ncbi:hypothetical protein GIB67_007682 [Kingdonia uniflora]|uniref:Uncharacterized protein n=1 Tax=Kingdonia uniflora TaxID=39325 RepID=A0A7J7N1H1_9MAGN|nr:hypothetical protein GIB67_007682 [Kingdonia uniflora]
MEGGRKTSSFSSDLFGSKTSSSPSSSSAIFDAVFSPSSKGREYGRSEVVGSWRKQDTTDNQPWNSKQGSSGTTSQSSKGGENHDPASKGSRSSIFQDETVRPCNFSSSIYYGGQDNYSSPSKHSGSSHVFKKDGNEDDCASRGNWWQGCLSWLLESNSYILRIFMKPPGSHYNNR